MVFTELTEDGMKDEVTNSAEAMKDGDSGYSLNENENNAEKYVGLVNV
jgi:hypothetical protein